MMLVVVHQAMDGFLFVFQCFMYFFILLLALPQKKQKV